jgi:hypothetical protein
MKKLKTLLLLLFLTCSGCRIGYMIYDEIPDAIDPPVNQFESQNAK